MNKLRTLGYWLYRYYARIRRPVTLGARALVIKDDEVLLVRLTYIKGWFLPGGGVDKNESFRDGVIRELREECAIEAKDPELFGLYFTTKQGRPDHVAIYVVKDFTAIPGARPDAEISEMKFFPLGALPEGITPATRRRIEEYVTGGSKTHLW